MFSMSPAVEDPVMRLAPSLSPGKTMLWLLGKGAPSSFSRVLNPFWKSSFITWVCAARMTASGDVSSPAELHQPFMLGVWDSVSSLEGDGAAGDSSESDTDGAFVFGRPSVEPVDFSSF